MPHTYSRTLLHIVFSTKDRKPLIAATFRKRLHAYIAGIIQRSDGHALIVNGTDDHIHILIALPAARSLSEMVRLIKSNSSKWIHETLKQMEFRWQRGFSAFSVSESNSSRVRAYIEHQEEHHRKSTFQDEYRKLLERHEIECDERFMWD